MIEVIRYPYHGVDEEKLRILADSTGFQIDELLKLLWFFAKIYDSGICAISGS